MSDEKVRLGTKMTKLPDWVKNLCQLSQSGYHVLLNRIDIHSFFPLSIDKNLRLTDVPSRYHMYEREAKDMSSKNTLEWWMEYSELYSWSLTALFHQNISRNGRFLLSLNVLSRAENQPWKPLSFWIKIIWKIIDLIGILSRNYLGWYFELKLSKNRFRHMWWLLFSRVSDKWTNKFFNHIQPVNSF